MNYYVGIDVSLEASSVCVIDAAGNITKELKVASDPDALHGALALLDLQIAQVGIEAGPLAPWLYQGLASQGLPIVCIESRRMQAFAKASPIKTDRRDARLIAQAIRTGLYRATHVKTPESQKIRLLLRHRQALVRRNKDLINTLRGTLKAFGIKIGAGKNTLLARRVRRVVRDPMLLEVTEPLLEAYEAGLKALERLDHIVLGLAKRDPICRQLMTVPGVGAVTALTFRTAVDVAQRFTKAQLVAAHFGLTPRVYASGEVEQVGRITKCGDAMVRWLLYEAANVMLTRCKQTNWLQAWAMRIAKRRGSRKAKVALARKLAVVMHRMWIDGTEFSYQKPGSIAA